MLQNKWKTAKKGLIALLAVTTIIAAAGCGKKTDTENTGNAGTASKDANEVIVTYKDGGKVTRGEFDTFIDTNLLFYKEYAQFKEEPAFQQDMMKQLVTFKVLSARADDKAKAEAATKSKQQLDQIKTFLGMQEGGMEKQLKDNNITEKDLESFVDRSFQAIAAMESKVTDDEVKAEYDKRITADKNVYDVATVRHILIGLTDPATGKETRSKEDALKRAKEVEDKLKNGGDFDALAKEYSDDPGSKDNGGKYEDAPISQWVPEFKKAAAELPLNQISDPVESSFGYHVMKVESRKTKTFDDVKGDLRSELAEPHIYDFVEKELPAMIETNKLPTPTPAPTPTPQPSGAPQPSATPAAPAK
ncbi:peptidylprolyl isomerase [Paenibacillus sp. 32352]|uniref:peptidylprolyl isomerase n=1 Tax=Paenibacillus sp. 32352 TaxID=1969111 RepID=UPI0009AE12F6|nr:peptidylprolyl isomerase [Paenibacillus sp. 32352]